VKQIKNEVKNQLQNTQKLISKNQKIMENSKSKNEKKFNEKPQAKQSVK